MAVNNLIGREETMAKSNRNPSKNAEATVEAPEGIVAQTVQVPEYTFATKKQLRARVRTLVRTARALEARSTEAIVHTPAGSFLLLLSVPSATAKYDEASYIIDNVPFAKREAYAKLMGEAAPAPKKAKAAKAEPADEDQDDDDTNSDALYEEDEEEEIVG